MERIRTYDILNAGPNNRFTANGCVVSNSGAIVQLQNLYRNSLPDLTQVRELVKQGNYDALKALYDSVAEVLAQCVRTAFIPAPGMKFIVADFSAIEARVLAWLADEQWVLDVFRNGGDIYCETASRMFHVPVEKHGRNAELRQKGKQATLSCGYGGSVGALKAMGAIEAGMKEEELQPLVNAWRKANPKIVKLWYAIDKAAKQALTQRSTTRTHGLVFTYRGAMLYITLPSGRNLSYVRPRMGANRFGSESITYEGNDFTKHWARVETFGGKLVENCIAQGSLIITDKGLVPIEKITTEMKVWDGLNFVRHKGLICRGKKDVISYDGVTATPEHMVFIGSSMKVPISEARRPLWEGYTHLSFDARPNRTGKLVFDILDAGPNHRFGIWTGKKTAIVSNCVQAISRDILCHAMFLLKEKRIVAHVHDELIIECPMDTKVDEICKTMATVPEWAPGLILAADGYEAFYYKK